jgi:hemerythrin
MTKTDIANGMSLVEIPDAGLSVLCGCPENAVKFLIKRGIIREVERDGQRFETGPNAILLSEMPVQGGRFRNLGEFPVLQMLYRQGMIIPGHPNNTGARPMIIGMRDQVEAQSRYIYSGNYGLSTIEELEATGLASGKTAELFRLKLKFAFGSIRKTEELLDLRVFDGHAIELRGGAFVRRIGANRYEFLHDGQSV